MIPNSKDTDNWSKRWSRCLIAVLATILLILTLAVIATELVSVLIDYVRATIYAGFFCSIFFTMASISLYIIVCCRTNSLPFAIFAVVANSLSISGAIVVIVFDALFIVNSSLCLVSFGSCTTGASALSSSTASSIYSVKSAMIRTQLACAGAIMIVNIIYIIMFIVKAVAYSKEQNKSTTIPFNGEPQRVHIIPEKNIPTIVPTGQHPRSVNYHPAPPTMVPRPGIHSPPVAHNHPPFLVQCPNCRTLIYAV